MILLAFLFLMSSSFAVMSYDGTTYTYFVNTQEPQVNITLKSFDDPYILQDAKIKPRGDSSSYISSIGEEYGAGEEANEILGLSSFQKQSSSFLSDFTLKHSDIFDFKLNVEGEGEGNPQTQGTPTNFEVFIDTKDPQFQYEEGLSNYVTTPQSPQIELQFSEPLQYLKISNEEKVFIEEQIYGTSIEDFITNRNFRVDDATEGLHEYDAVLVDRAGNRVETTLSVLISGEPLDIKLLTKADDSLIPYYYNSSHQDLFGSSIYTDSQNFDLQLKTSKPATCYYTQRISEDANINTWSLQDTLENVENDGYEKLNTTNDKLHTISVDFPSSSDPYKRPFWVGCENKYDSTDTLFLSQVLKDSKDMLIFEHYDEDFSMNVDSPAPLVAQEEVYFQATTSQRAFCEVSLNNGNIPLEKEEESTKHTYTTGFDDGNYDFTFNCYDVVYNQESQTKEVEVDKDAGIDITYTSKNYYEGIYYSRNSQVQVNFSTGQVPNQCRYSTQSISPQVTEDFNNAQEISTTSSDNQFSFTSETLVAEQNNTHYIYCRDQNNVTTTEKLPILYDSQGPQLTNLRYENGGVESEEYIGSSSTLNTVFDVDSVIPIESFNVSFFGNNTSTTKGMDNSLTNRNYTKQLSVSESLDNYNRVVVIANTILGTRSEPLQGNYEIDMSPPEISLTQLGGEWQINCRDNVSGCAKTFIGVGKTQDSCSPVQQYLQNTSLNTTGYSYVCAKGQNTAGVNSAVTYKETGFVPTTGQEDNESFFDDEENTTEENETTTQDENTTEEEPYQPDEFSPEEEEDSNAPYYILSAILVFVAFGGAGGWYAYRKGYLDTQLKKLGIISGDNKGSGNRSQGSNGTNTQGTSQKVKPKLVSKKSKYDKHLQKLNKFLDDALDSKQDVYDSFGGSQKGKSKGYKDSMHNTSADKDSAFDEFYKASDKEDSSTPEEESDKFEHYYKQNDKKQNNKK